MKDLIINILRNKLGLDRSIAWGGLNKAFGLIKGPVSLYFLITYLTPQEQGLWYTFFSLSALTIFAELGFTSIITQFVSHEYARLINKEGINNGESSEIDRLLGLIKFSIKIYLFIIPIAIAILVIVGLFYFKTESLTVYMAWFTFSFVGGFILFLGLLQSIYQGLDRVKVIQMNIFFSSVIIALFNWTMLMMHFKIWALVLGQFLGLMVSSYLLYKIDPKFWKLVINYKVQHKYDFLKETLPLQWRYAITWVSSYFITYLMVPATYKLVGKAQAGQMGMTLVILTAISGIANNWITSKVPRFNILVSLKDNLTLNQLFKRATLQGLSVQLIISGIYVMALLLLQIFFPSIAERFLNVELTILLIGPQIAQSLISAFATYLRAHKEEPLMWVAVINALCMVVAVFGILAQNFGLKTFFYSLNIFYWILILPLSIKIFYRKRKIYVTKYF